MTGPNITHGRGEGRAVVRIEGELDFASVGRVTDELERVLAAEPGGLLLDLSATGFIDSAGINLLFEVHRALAARGEGLALAVPPESLIRRTLAITGAEEAFAVHASVDDAAPASGQAGEQPPGWP